MLDSLLNHAKTTKSMSSRDGPRGCLLVLCPRPPPYAPTLASPLPPSLPPFPSSLPPNSPAPPSVRQQSRRERGRAVDRSTLRAKCVEVFARLIARARRACTGGAEGVRGLLGRVSQLCTRRPQLCRALSLATNDPWDRVRREERDWRVRECSVTCLPS